MTNEEIKRLAELEALLIPNHQVSEEEHRLAHVRYVMEDIIEDSFFHIFEFVKRITDPDNLKNNQYYRSATLEKLQNWAVAEVERLDRCYENEDATKEIWERYDSSNHFRYYRHALEHESHSGDCTAFPASCALCHAENHYKIPSTVKWSKGDGYRMENERMNLTRKLKEEQEMNK